MRQNTSKKFRDLLGRSSDGVNQRMKKSDLKQLIEEVENFVLDTLDTDPTNQVNLTVREQRQFMMAQYRDLSTQYNERFVFRRK